jgi:hypothetical protein
MLKELFIEILKGKSLGRTLLNLRLRTVTLEGQGLDLGSKSGPSSYCRFFSIAKDTKIIFTDLRPQSEKVLPVDLEKNITVADNSQGTSRLWSCNCWGESVCSDTKTATSYIFRLLWGDWNR